MCQYLLLGWLCLFSSTHLSTCALPEKCDLNEAIPRDTAVNSSVTGSNLSGNILGAGGETGCGGAATCAQGSLQPTLSQLTCHPERAVPHLRAQVLYGWRFLSWDTALQFLSSSFALLQSWTNQALVLCIRSAQRACKVSFGEVDLGTKTSRAGVGKGFCRLCQQIYLSLVRVKSCGTETKLLWFLGSPKSKGWVGSYFFLISVFLWLPSLALFAICLSQPSGSCSHLEATQLLKLLFF